MVASIGFSSNGSSAELDAAIETLFTNGGLPAQPFATKALMTASALANGSYAQVTDDTANNGLYLKIAGAWVKSTYDPLGLAKQYIDEQSIPIKNKIIGGDFSAGLTGWTVTNNPTIDTTVYNSAPQSLKVNSTGSSAQVSRTFTAVAGHKYYLSVRARLTRRTAGTLGANVELGSVNNSVTIGTIIPNSSFERFSTIKTATGTAGKIFAGGITGANLDGNVDDLILVDLSEAFGEGGEPSLSDFEKIIGSDYFESKNLGSKFLYQNQLGLPPVSYTDEQCRAAFIAKMNEKAAQLRMTNTNYVNTSGIEAEAQTSTVKDTLKLAVRAIAYNDIVQAWSKKTYSFQVGGSNPRIQSISSTVQSPDLENYYTILGGKTGTNGVPYATENVVVIVQAPNNNWFVGCVFEATGGRFTAAKQLFDIATQISNGQTPTSTSVVANKACVAYVPKNNVFAYEDFFPTLWGKNESVIGHQASITKVMTAIVMLDYVSELDEKITIPYAISSTSLVAGDTITYRDALYCMLLPSSNSMAVFMSEIVGNKILNSI